MIYLKTQVVYEIVIQKSRFITILTPIESFDDIPFILTSIKKRYPKANHYCTAYILGEYGQYQGSSDDGEPSGTAGVPMLEILRGRELTGIFAVVVRYFGGIKLGAGGLIRAYAGAVKDTLNEVGLFYQKIKAPVYQVRFSYHLIAVVEQVFSNELFIDKTYGEDVIYTLCFLKNDTHKLEEMKHLFLEVKPLSDKELHIAWP